ncbi:GerMN domain-containing protein [Jiangella ureilytica]|uniref:GerMN domain-containing protein n=1 Tax=Jiangella ureilytica TaxID=2530374 RepID=UPI0013A5C555|nr:GerMN domain-containing protein [Jiangella ureilytica]
MTPRARRRTTERAGPSPSGTAALLAVLLCPLGGCGVPSDDAVRVINDAEVPYQLLEDPEQTPPTGPAPEQSLTPHLYWVDTTEHLVARTPAGYCVATRAEVVEEVLEQLEAGPPENDRTAGIGTALPPEEWVTLADLDGDTARLQVTPNDAIGAGRVTLAAAQVVLSVTSIAGISRVELLHDQEELQVPLPDGELATGPLGASDYATLLATPQDPPPTGSALGSDLSCPSPATPVQ